MKKLIFGILLTSSLITTCFAEQEVQVNNIDIKTETSMINGITSYFDEFITSIVNILEHKNTDTPSVDNSAIILDTTLPVGFIGEFHEGYAIVTDYDASASSYGYINTGGIEVIPMKYDFASDFNNGIALVRLNDVHYLIDTKGNLTEFAVQYDYLESFNADGIAIARTQLEDGSTKAFFVDLKGNKLTKEYDNIWNFKDGYAPVSLNGKWGYVDSQFNEVVPIIYDMFDPYNYGFTDGIAIARMGEYYGYIDTEGNAITEFEYGSAFPFSDGLALVTDTSVDRFTTPLYGYINKEGEEVIPLQYQFADNFSDGLAYAQFDGSVGSSFIDTDGNIALKLPYEYLGSFEGGVALVQQDGKDGYINKSGEVVIDINYMHTKDLNNNIVSLRDADTLKYGAMDMSGNIIIPFEYDILDDADGDGYYYGVKYADGSMYLININK